MSRSVLIRHVVTLRTLTRDGEKFTSYSLCSLLILAGGRALTAILCVVYQPLSFVSQSTSSGNPSLHCSMSSSADFSDEDDYSLKSGSASPAPGDTLPWNLPRHERSKRKIQGGSILDPAERAVLRIAGEQLPPCVRLYVEVCGPYLPNIRKYKYWALMIHHMMT